MKSVESDDMKAFIAFSNTRRPTASPCHEWRVGMWMAQAGPTQACRGKEARDL
jgi:hypothetical protein